MGEIRPWIAPGSFRNWSIVLRYRFAICSLWLCWWGCLFTRQYPARVQVGTYLQNTWMLVFRREKKRGWIFAYINNGSLALFGSLVFVRSPSWIYTGYSPELLINFYWTFGVATTYCHTKRKTLSRIHSFCRRKRAAIVLYTFSAR